MKSQTPAARKRILYFCLLSAILYSLTIACAGSAALKTARLLQNDAATAVPVEIETPIIPTPTPGIIPATGLDALLITGCPDWDIDEMYEKGAYLYGFYCVGCHGRQGQGAPSSSFFPPLVGGTLAESEDISRALLIMMNTDMHPQASLLFEKDALAVINYIRITFASNTDLICPGEYIIEINP